MHCLERYFNFISSSMGLYICVKVKLKYSLSLSLCAGKENSVQYSVGKSVILWFGSVVSSEHIRLKLDSVDRLQY